MPEEIVRARVRVTGLVQGVFFRASTRDEAASLGLQGWVRNLPEGDVEVAFEGPPHLVDRAIEWTRHGPPASHVERVEVTREEPQGERGFRIRH